MTGDYDMYKDGTRYLEDIENFSKCLFQFLPRNVLNNVVTKLSVFDNRSSKKKVLV